jgi:transposase InsO family protein
MPFARRYTDKDVFTLAETEREYGRLSGPAMVVVLRRMYQLYNDERYERLQHLSPSHLYNLRRSHAYRLHHMTYTKTRPKPQRCGNRRTPGSGAREPPGLYPHRQHSQGNTEQQRGVYHINAVDCVTQWEVAATVPTLQREHMLPVLRDMIDQFPFRILGFHSDGGSEYINHDVAKMLGEQLVDFTRSRPRRCNDNALAESKNGNVVRRQFGYSYIPAEWAKQFNAFLCRSAESVFEHAPALSVRHRSL